MFKLIIFIFLLTKNIVSGGDKDWTEQLRKHGMQMVTTEEVIILFGFTKQNTKVAFTDGKNTKT